MVQFLLEGKPRQLEKIQKSCYQSITHQAPTDHVYIPKNQLAQIDGVKLMADHMELRGPNAYILALRFGKPACSCPRRKMLT
jgi:hypothetical protein